MNLRILAIGVTFVFSANLPAQAENATVSKEPPARQVKRLNGDENKDGMVSKLEYLNAAARRFDQIDANKDGNIVANEQRAYDDARRESKEKKEAAKKIKAEEKPADQKGFLNRFFN